MRVGNGVLGRPLERFLAVITAFAVLVAVALAVAPQAQAHNGTVAWDCEGWSIDLNAYGAGASITIVVDGGTPIVASGWRNYDNSGSWDPAENHTLYVEVDAYDDPDQPVYNNPSSPFSPNWRSGEWSFTLNARQESCIDPTTTTTQPTTTTTQPTTTTTQPTTTTTQPTTTTTQPTTTTTEPTTTTTEPTTTTTEPTTTTTEVSATTVTAPPSTTTSSTIPDEVLPTSITAAPSTTEAPETLPFTGGDPGMPAMLALTLTGLGALALLVTRGARDES